VDTNAAELMPNGSHTILVTGELDTISPPRVAHDYAARAHAAGDSAEVVILPGASHYDEVAASSPSWPLVAAAIERALAHTPDKAAYKTTDEGAPRDAVKAAALPAAR
jgi:acetyl esterase/lipase